MKRALMAPMLGAAIAVLSTTDPASAQQPPGATPSGSTPTGAASTSVRPAPITTSTSAGSTSARPASISTSTTVAASANTAQPQQIDRTEGKIAVSVEDPKGEHRTAAIEWNPLALIALGKLSFNVVVTPAEHHALVLSPHYQWAETAPIYKFADPSSDPNSAPTSRVGTQHFKALGGEIGYRYYSGRGGMRGWFIGPSLILDAVWANPQNGPMKKFGDIGLAVDTGYQVLIADDVSIGLGVGVQGMLTTTKIPEQQFPAHTIANREVDPRVLLSLGWAF